MVTTPPLKIAILADIHGNIRNLKKSIPELQKTDAIVIAGDIAGTINLKLILKTIIKSKRISREKYVDFVYSEGKEAFYAFQKRTMSKIFTLLSKLEKPVFFTHGNVELQELYRDYRKLSDTQENFHYLENNVITYRDFIISGYGFCQPSNYRTAFKTPGERDLKQIKRDLDKLKQDIDYYRNKNSDATIIGIFHEPPFQSKCDYIPNKNAYVGNPLLREHIEHVRYDYVFVGHIHEAQCFTYLNKTLIINPGPLVENKFAILNILNNSVSLKEFRTFFSKEMLIYTLRKFFP